MSINVDYYYAYPYQPYTWLYQPNGVCPGCGRCNQCGRGGSIAQPFWPTWPSTTAGDNIGITPYETTAGTGTGFINGKETNCI